MAATAAAVVIADSSSPYHQPEGIEFGDCFPTDISSQVPVLQHPVNLQDWTALADSENIRVVLYRLLTNGSHTLVYNLLSQPRGRQNWPTKLLDNFIRTGKESSVMNSFQPNRIFFDKMEKRLSKPIQVQQNTDIRLSFCWNNRHVFLVKSQFTFGQRSVPSGRAHLLQTTYAPLMFYVWSPSNHTDEYTTDYCRSIECLNFEEKDGRFHRNDQFVYNRYILQPHTSYLIPENTVYLLVTVQKTLFSIHVVETVSVDNLKQKFECVSPFRDRKLLVDGSRLMWQKWNKKDKFQTTSSSTTIPSFQLYLPSTKRKQSQESDIVSKRRKQDGSSLNNEEQPFMSEEQQSATTSQQALNFQTISDECFTDTIQSATTLQPEEIAATPEYDQPFSPLIVDNPEQLREHYQKKLDRLKRMAEMIKNEMSIFFLE